MGIMGSRLPNSEYNKGAPSAIRWTVMGLAAYALIGGGVTLVGWFAGMPRLTDWVASGISMFPNAALAAMCAGTALILAMQNRRWCARVSGVLSRSLNSDWSCP